MRILLTLLLCAGVSFAQPSFPGYTNATLELSATLSRTTIPAAGLDGTRHVSIFITGQDLVVRSASRPADLRNIAALADEGFEEFGNDGTNSYYVHAYPKENQENLKRKTTNRSFVRHFRGRLPNLTDGPLGMAALPWVLSLTCPADPAKFMAAPFAPAIPRLPDLGFTLSATATRLAGAPEWVVDYVDYRDKNLYIEEDDTIKTKKYQHDKFNLTNSHFSVLAFTNFHGLNLPSSWRMTRHWLDPQKMQDYRDEIRVAVNAIASLGSNSPARFWTPPSWVADTRFTGPKGNGISYSYATTNVLRTEEHILADQDFKDQQAHSLLTAKKRRFNPAIFIIFLLLLLGPLAILFRKSNQKHESVS